MYNQYNHVQYGGACIVGEAQKGAAQVCGAKMGTLKCGKILGARSFYSGDPDLIT